MGDVVEATGKGFKNGTSLTFFVDKAVHRGTTTMTRIRRWQMTTSTLTMTTQYQTVTLELDEDVLCVAEVGGDDVGTCSFTVSSPTFSGGDNYVNAVDGRSNIASDPDGETTVSSS